MCHADFLYLHRNPEKNIIIDNMKTKAVGTMKNIFAKNSLDIFISGLSCVQKKNSSSSSSLS